MRIDKDAVTLARDLVATLAILCGGIWAIFTLYTQHQREDIYYRGRALAVSPACKLEYVGATNSVHLFTAQVSLVSASRIRFFVLDSPYELVAEKIRELERSMPLDAMTSAAQSRFQTPYPFRQNARFGESQLIPVEFGRLWRPGAVYLEPGEKYEDSLTIAVTKSTLETFETLILVLNMILTEDPSKLGSITTVGNQGQLETSLVVYPRKKAEVFALTDESQDKVAIRIPVAEALKLRNVALLKESNTVPFETSCVLVSPLKSPKVEVTKQSTR
jgi:hypothetical protein